MYVETELRYLEVAEESIWEPANIQFEEQKTKVIKL